VNVAPGRHPPAVQPQDSTVARSESPSHRAGVPCPSRHRRVAARASGL